MIAREKRLKTSSDDVLTRGGGDARDDDGDQQLDMFKVGVRCEVVEVFLTNPPGLIPSNFIFRLVSVMKVLMSHLML